MRQKTTKCMNVRGNKVWNDTDIDEDGTGVEEHAETLNKSIDKLKEEVGCGTQAIFLILLLLVIIVGVSLDNIVDHLKDISIELKRTRTQNIEKPEGGKK